MFKHPFYSNGWFAKRMALSVRNQIMVGKLEIFGHNFAEPTFGYDIFRILGLKNPGLRVCFSTPYTPSTNTHIRSLGIYISRYTTLWYHFK